MAAAIVGGLISVCFLMVVTIFFVKSYQFGMGRVSNPFSDYRNILIFVLFSSIGFILCYHIASQNQFVYYWDLGGYWTLSFTTVQGMFLHPLETIKEVFLSIWIKEYNSFLPMLLIIPLKLFGYTFLHYILVVYVFFFLPSVFLMTSVGWKLLSEEQRCPVYFFLLALLAFSLSAFYGPILGGYADIGALIPGTLAILLAIDGEFLSWDKSQKHRVIYISLLLVCSFVMRRYFSYFIVGYMAALVLCTLSKIAKEHNRRAKLLCLFKNLCWIGGTAIITLSVFCGGAVGRILLTSYAQAYAGYDRPFFDKLLGVNDYFGLFVLFMVLAAIVIALLYKRQRQWTIFFLLMATVAMLSFFHVQAMGAQHIYVLCIPIYLLSVLACVQITEIVSKTKILIVILTAFLMLGTFHSFGLIPQCLPRLLAVAYPSITFHPMQRDDISELHALADYLNERADAFGSDIYVLASGKTLNSSILDALNKPYETKAVPRLCMTHDVDLRDGFPASFLHAKIVVVTDPVDLHLTPGSQEVVRYLAMEVQNSESPVGKHFQKDVKEFSLDNNTNVLIYNKIDDFTQEDLHSLADYYAALYPGKEKMFSDRILSGKEEKIDEKISSKKLSAKIKSLLQKLGVYRSE